jgi:sarcosine oxidase, subunit beta
MSSKNFDIIIIGAGSVGLPTAYFLSKEKLSVLIIDEMPSAGQGQNKAAIGGIRATHSDPAKILTCLLSLKVFSSWKEETGDDIHFQRGGYSFPVYDEKDEKTLKDLLKIQKEYGLNIDWLDKKEIQKILIGINPENLKGGTYSPDDANVSPLLSCISFYNQSRIKGAKFKFNEKVMDILKENDRVAGVKTPKDIYFAPIVINCAGACARQVGEMAGLDIPVYPDSHEAGITEPVKKFFEPLVVDVRGDELSKNFYFYQNPHGQVVFCLTPNPLVPGYDDNASSSFLPIASRRMINLFPKLQNIKVRRTWRGLYPMTPDGVPIVDEVKKLKGFYLAVGLCGQGFMLGPGIALNLVNIILKGTPVLPLQAFKGFSFYRDFGGAQEVLR